MGAYINPTVISKESFLDREGSEILWKNKPMWKEIPHDFLPVILVNNGPFTAAGIGFDKKEYEMMTGDEDKRPRRLFLVEKEKLLEVSLDLKKYLDILQKIENENR